MQVIVVGGFLGSGKTTTIINMGKYLAERGRKVAIIVNEIGEIGIDGDVIKRFGFDTKEITSGCICCSLKVGLRTTVTLLAKEYKPDILMIEPTGIAFPHVIKDEIELMNLGDKVNIAPLVTLIDGSRFKHLMKEVKDFAMRQIIDAEILGINKVDLIEPIRLPILEESVHQLNPKARIILLSGKNADEKFDQFMQIVLPDTAEVPEEIPKSTVEKKPENYPGEKPDFASQETESSIEASGVGSYAVEFAVKNENLSTEAAREITTELMNTIKEKVLKLNPEFVGHIKLFLDNGSETVKQSVTAYYEEPQEQIIKSEEGATPDFKVLSAVSNVNKTAIKEAVDNSVTEIFMKRGILGQKHDNHEHAHEQESHEHEHVQKTVSLMKKK